MPPARTGRDSSSFEPSTSTAQQEYPGWGAAFYAEPALKLSFPDGNRDLVLNLARDDVRDHVLRVLDELLTQNDIAFLKWDYNRNWSEPGWPGQAPEEQQKVYVAGFCPPCRDRWASEPT